MWRLPRLLVVSACLASGASLPGPEALAQQGDAAYRKLELEAARQSYESALDADPASGRALRGLSRIALGRGQRELARDLIARAYRLHPRDPEVIRAYAAFVTDPAAERVLLQNYLAVAPSAQQQAAALRLRLLDALDGRQANALTTGYRPYRLATRRFYPSASEPAAGLMLTVRINGGQPLRLLFDTGARGIYLPVRAGRALGLKKLGECAAAGPGEDMTPGWMAIAGSVRFGAAADGPEFGNVPVEVLDMRFPDGVDGVVGAAMFERFLVRASDRQQRLDLEPLPHNAMAAAAVPAFRSGHLLLLPSSEGYFVLDTGSAFHVRNTRHSDGPDVGLYGAGGAITGARRTQPQPLQLGGRAHFSRSWVAMDLTRMSKAEGLEIAGIAGYPLLRQSDLTINYRDGWIRLAGQE